MAKLKKKDDVHPVISKYMAELGRKGGVSRSEEKAKASRENGKKAVAQRSAVQR